VQVENLKERILKSEGNKDKRNEMKTKNLWIKRLSNHCFGPVVPFSHSPNDPLR
jgi:hypothetical protein